MRASGRWCRSVQMLINVIKLLRDDVHEMKEVTPKCADIIFNSVELASECGNICLQSLDRMCMIWYGYVISLW